MAVGAERWVRWVTTVPKKRLISLLDYLPAVVDLRVSVDIFRVESTYLENALRTVHKTVFAMIL
jgi:hypothetical protein